MFSKEELARIRSGQKSWENGPLAKDLETTPETKEQFTTGSGIPVKRVYTPLDLEERGWSYNEKLGFPGEYPFTRGKTPDMYRNIPWKAYSYAGFGTAESTNKWYKYLLQQGTRELGVALDLPTQIGYDSDNPFCRGEVTKIGVAVASLADVEEIFDGIPIEETSISTVAGAIGPIFLAWMIALAEKRGIPPQKLILSIQGDVLREIISRGTQIFPPQPSVKFTCDSIEYAARNGIALQNCNCGYHMKEAGSNSIQEIAFTLANSCAYIRELLSRGLTVDQLPQPRILFAAGTDFFEEICKARAFRRMWARTLKEKFHARNPRSMCFTYQFGSQSSLYTAQQPLNNIIRGTIIGLIEALSGGQVNSVARYTEALSLPTPESATIAIRTQQILANETGIPDTIDPLAGAYFVEVLTDEIEERAMKLFEEVEAMGGAITAIEQGFMQKQIKQSAYDDLKKIESGERVRIGLNKFQTDEPVTSKLMKVDPTEEQKQVDKVTKLRQQRDNGKVKSSLKELKQAAQAGENLVAPILVSVRAYATIGEICDVLRGVFGEYQDLGY